MDKLVRVITFALNVLTVIISIVAFAVIVSWCRQGYIPDGQNTLYSAAFIGWLFCLVTTFYLDVKVFQNG